MSEEQNPIPIEEADPVLASMKPPGAASNEDGSYVYQDPNPASPEEAQDQGALPPGTPERGYYEERDGQKVLVVPRLEGDEPQPSVRERRDADGPVVYPDPDANSPEGAQEEPPEKG
jgi:hypothetical protein